MERYLPSSETSSETYVFSAEDVELGEAPKSPEAYPDCLVQAMHSANAGSGYMREQILTTVVETQGRTIAMACGRCSIALVRDEGVVYGASKCPRVRAGDETLGELA